MVATTELPLLQHNTPTQNPMAIRANKFTPRALLSAPRRSTGVPNSDGSRVLFTSSTYCFEEHKKTVEIRVLDAKTNESKLIASHSELSEPNWLDDDTIFLLEHISSENTSGISIGETGILIGPVDDFENGHYVAGIIPGPAGSVKIKKTPNEDSYAIAFSAGVRPNGELNNPDAYELPYSSARIYDSIWVRHWDTWQTRNHNALWYSSLRLDSGSQKWTLTQLVNALADTKLISPIPTFGGTDHFDISPTGLIFVAKDPDLNPALHTKCNVYLVPLDSFTQAPAPEPVKIALPKGVDGAATSPVFAPGGASAAFLAMREDGYEADRNRVLW